VKSVDDSFVSFASFVVPLFLNEDVFRNPGSLGKLGNLRRSLDSSWQSRQDPSSSIEDPLSNAPTHSLYWTGIDAIFGASYTLGRSPKAHELRSMPLNSVPVSPVHVCSRYGGMGHSRSGFARLHCEGVDCEGGDRPRWAPTAAFWQAKAWIFWKVLAISSSRSPR
jgi:hypothetical protein